MQNSYRRSSEPNIHIPPYELGPWNGNILPAKLDTITLQEVYISFAEHYRANLPHQTSSMAKYLHRPL